MPIEVKLNADVQTLSGLNFVNVIKSDLQKIERVTMTHSGIDQVTGLSSFVFSG